MQNLYETVKKAQMVVQVEAVRVQKELAEYVLLLKSLSTNLYLFIFLLQHYWLLWMSFASAEQSLMVTAKAS